MHVNLLPFIHSSVVSQSYSLTVMKNAFEKLEHNIEGSVLFCGCLIPRENSNSKKGHNCAYLHQKYFNGYLALCIASPFSSTQLVQVNIFSNNRDNPKKSFFFSPQPRCRQQQHSGHDNKLTMSLKTAKNKILQ